MTLTARLSLFFLVALALVLAGFSTALYLLAQAHLYGQADRRLHAAMATLTAASQNEEQEVEWLPQDHRVNLGQDDGPDQVRWTVHDLAGRVIDRSPNLVGADFPPEPAPLLGGPVAFQVERQGQRWQLLRQCVLSGRIAAEAEREDQGQLTARLKKMDDEPPTRGKKAAPPGKGRKKKTQVLVLTAGLALDPVESTLWQLGWSLGGLSVGVWMVAALLGRLVCRRALLPVTRMAQGARAIRADHLDQRLPVSAAGDELTELGTAFNDLLARLEQTFEQQRRFTGDASHQLRTPLTAVLGQIEVALRRDRSAEEYRRVLATVQGQAGQLRQIVESLLFLARADVETCLPDLDIVDAAAWLSEHVAAWERQPRWGDLRCDIVKGQSLQIRAQQPLLGQLLDNLWDNAGKYSEPGTSITIQLTADADAVVLTFADAGRGVAEPDLPHIFEPFYRAAPVRMHGISGIGLGLAVVQRIVKGFGGSITVTSQSGQGTCFQIRFPRLVSEQIAEKATSRPPVPIQGLA